MKLIILLTIFTSISIGFPTDFKSFKNYKNILSYILNQTTEIDGEIYNEINNLIGYTTNSNDYISRIIEYLQESINSQPQAPNFNEFNADYSQFSCEELKEELTVLFEVSKYFMMKAVRNEEIIKMLKNFINSGYLNTDLISNIIDLIADNYAAQNHIFTMIESIDDEIQEDIKVIAIYCRKVNFIDFKNIEEPEVEIYGMDIDNTAPEIVINILLEPEGQKFGNFEVFDDFQPESDEFSSFNADDPLMDILLSDIIEDDGNIQYITDYKDSDENFEVANRNDENFEKFNENEEFDENIEEFDANYIVSDADYKELDPNYEELDADYTKIDVNNQKIQKLSKKPKKNINAKNIIVNIPYPDENADIKQQNPKSKVQKAENPEFSANFQQNSEYSATNDQKIANNFNLEDRNLTEQLQIEDEEDFEGETTDEELDAENFNIMKIPQNFWEIPLGFWQGFQNFVQNLTDSGNLTEIEEVPSQDVENIDSNSEEDPESPKNEEIKESNWIFEEGDEGIDEDIVADIKMNKKLSGNDNLKDEGTEDDYDYKLSETEESMLNDPQIEDLELFEDDFDAENVKNKNLTDEEEIENFEEQEELMKELIDENTAEDDIEK